MAKLSLVALALSASTVLALDHAGGDHHWGVRAAAEANTVTSAAHKASATVKEAVAASSTITAKAKVAAASASASALPLTGYTYSYADIPYMVSSLQPCSGTSSCSFFPNGGPRRFAQATSLEPS